MKSAIPLFDKAATSLVMVFTLALGYVGGSWAAYPLMALAVVVMLMSAATRRALWLAKDWAGPAFGAAFVLLAIAFVFNHDVAHVFNFIMFLLFAPLAAALSRHASPRNALWVATLANIGCGLGFAVAMVQVFWLRLPLASGFGSDPIWSSQAGIMIAFIALLGLMTEDRPRRLVFVFGPVAMLVAVFLSGSRGPLLAVPALFGVFILLGTKRWWLSLTLAVASTALLIFAAALFWPAGLERLTSVYTVLIDLVSKGQITEASGGERQLMYAAGFAAFWASPLIGNGWGGLMNAIVPFLPAGSAALAEIHHHLHNDALDFAVSGGALGILSYLLVLAAPWLGLSGSSTDSQWRFRRASTIGLSIGYVFFGLTYLTFGYEYHTTLYVCLAAILVGFCRDVSPSRATDTSKESPISPRFP